MYAVVGCDVCHALWILEGRPETSQCPRCGKTRNYEKRRKFVRTEDENHARDVRSSMLAARSGHDEAFAELGSFAELEAQADDAGVDDETYLESSGIDTAEIDSAVDRFEGGQTRSRQEIVREALRELDQPSEEDVIAYAFERGVPEPYTERALEKLVQAGEVTEHRGRYRLV